MVGTPANRLRRRRGDDPICDAMDEAGLFGERDELIGLDDPSRGVIPADERLGAGNPPEAAIELRLILEE